MYYTMYFLYKYCYSTVEHKYNSGAEHPMRISVIIPTLNEEGAIGRVLDDMPENPIDELVVVDSSTDNTPRIADKRGAQVIFESKRGYGRALQTGIENTAGDILVYIDGDNTYDPREIPKIVQPILNGEYDVVLGSRLRGRMFPGAMSPLIKLGNLLLSLFFDVLLLKRITDSQSGFRAMRRHFLEGLTYSEYGMPFVTEQLIKLIKRGARVGEVPICYRPRIGETKLCKWTDGFKIFKVILKGRFLGGY